MLVLGWLAARVLGQTCDVFDLQFVFVSPDFHKLLCATCVSDGFQVLMSVSY